MKLNPGFKFIVLIVITLFAAIALRAFASNRGNRTFTVTITGDCVEVKHNAGAFFENLKKADPHCSLDKVDWCSETEVFRLLDLAEKHSKASPLRRDIRNGSPHVQQTAVFTTAKGLQAFVNELDTATTHDKTAPPKPNTSPAPQVQQHVESTTPQAAKAITLALSR
jgi:hypothetical protein